MACRSTEKANAAAQDIMKMTGVGNERLVVMKLDLSSTASIRQFVKDFKGRMYFFLSYISFCNGKYD